MSNDTTVQTLTERQDIVDNHLEILETGTVYEVDKSQEVETTKDSTPTTEVREEKQDGGGCSTFMKIIVVIIAVAVSYFVPALAPVAISAATQVLAPPQQQAGNNGGKAADQAAIQADNTRFVEEARARREAWMEQWQRENGVDANQLQSSGQEWGIDFGDEELNSLAASAFTYFEGLDLPEDGSVSNYEILTYADTFLRDNGIGSVVDSGIDLSALGLSDEEAEAFISYSNDLDEQTEQDAETETNVVL